MPQDPLFDLDSGPPPVRRVRKAFDRTVGELRKLGRVEPSDSLLIAIGRTCSDGCDELRGVEGMEYHEAQRLRLALEVEARLRGVGGPVSDAFDQLLAAATGPTTPSD
jgi:hypothetical protein